MKVTSFLTFLNNFQANLNLKTMNATIKGVLKLISDTQQPRSRQFMAESFSVEIALFE